MWTPDPSLQNNFYVEMHHLAAVIRAPEADLPGFEKPTYEGLWVEIDGPAPVYRLMYTERGKDSSVLISSNPQNVLEEIFSGITFSMATSYEVQHRIEGEDSRRQWFVLQENLMRELKPEWGENEARRHAEILRTAPFVDQ